MSNASHVWGNGGRPTADHGMSAVLLLHPRRASQTGRPPKHVARTVAAGLTPAV
ncbi:MAG: hypothetical protein R2706_06080 [Acidimicrobiales bacterium]